MTNLMHFFIFFIFITCGTVNSARILGVFHMPAYSHYQLGDTLLKALAARGHDVTVITPFPSKHPVENFKEIILTGIADNLQVVKKNLFEQTESNMINNVLWLEAIGSQLAENALNHTNVQKLLNSNQQFDLVILNQFINDAFKGFCSHYNAPCIVLCAVSAPSWTHSQIANPDSPAYIPDVNSDPTYDPTKFTHRVVNSFTYIALKLFNHFYALPRQNEILQKYFPNSPPLSELYYNTSLILVNSHVSLNPALPYLPNMIEIGGFHIKPPKKLPRDLQEYLDSAKDGVILFSLGSNLQSKDMSREKRESILKAFSKIKQKVLWKWEEETLPNQPPNVKLSKWLPQSDILAHPNIKLFVTHGGLLSTTEAVYHGVPIIAISVLGDQEKNGKVSEKSGFGISVPYRELDEEKLTYALNELLSNPKYTENVKKRSEIMHDEPMKQLDKAVFWTEYVIRHKGAPHLRSAALSLHWYQYLLLDVVVVAFLIAFVPLFVIYKIFRKLCCSRSKKTIEKAVSKDKKKN